MAGSVRAPSILTQLRRFLMVAGEHPGRWATTTIAASIALALLDTLGVAAMIPLTQLLAGVPADSGVLAVIADMVGSTEPTVLIPVVATAVAVLFVGKSALALLFRWQLFGRTFRVSALVATELMRRYMLSPYPDHRSRRLSEVYRSISASVTQAASVLFGVISLATDALMLAGIVAVLAWASPAITLLTVGLFAGFVFGLQRALRERQAVIGEEFAEASLEAIQFLMPALDGFREARLTSSASMFIEGFRRSRMREARASRVMSVMAEIPRYALEILFVVAIVAISLYLLSTQSAASAFTVLGLFAAAALRALPTLTRLSATFGTIRTGSVGLRIVLDAAQNLEAGGIHDEVPRSSRRYRGDIVLDDVTFRYPDAAADVFTGLSLRIAENRTTSFVGSSGAGKSTLLDLVLGLQTPTTGTITCGERSIYEDPAAWYDTLGVVPQDVFLMNDTVRANIAFGIRPADVDEATLREVISLAHLTSVIEELPEGLNTVIGERGVRLSGGQRQRLGLARALYRRPTVLVLDEATSALDNETEHEITATLAGLGGSLTIIVVAHRLSTVRQSDQLYFLKDGRVEAEGSFDDMRRTSQEFARVVALGELK